MTDNLDGTGQSSPFRLLETRVYRGPNLYSRRPLIRMRVDLGELEHWPTDRIPGIADHILQLLPGLRNHGCSCPDKGGFPFRLEQGTWLGHVIEHVALELQTLAGTPISRGKTRSVRGQPGQYDVMFRFRDEDVGLAAGKAAIDLVLSLLPPSLAPTEVQTKPPSDVAEIVAALDQLRARKALGPSTAALVEQRNGEVFRLHGSTNRVSFGWVTEAGNSG